MADIFNV